MKILNNSSIAQYTTLKIGGMVAKEYLLETKEDLEEMATLLDKDSLPHLLLGGGSNVLIDDKNLDLVLIRDTIDAKKEIEILEDTKDFVILKVSSGMYLPLFVQYCAKNGYSGLEGLTGIPGRMGGGLAMNIGAFNCQISDVFVEATIFSPNHGFKVYTRDDVEFAYRHFRVLDSLDYAMHADMTFKLLKTSKEAVKARIDECFMKKKASQPLKEKTAGCVFKNPTGDFAGRLLEEAGMKGFRLTNMGFSDIHASFMVNHGNGSYNEALDLLAIAKEKVLDTSGITLEFEIKILSDNLG